MGILKKLDKIAEKRVETVVEKEVPKPPQPK